MFIRNDPKLKKRHKELRQNQTEAEKLLWSQLRNNRFYGVKFFRQYSIGPYVLDFYSPTLRLVIELDGGQHSEQEQQEYDENRSEYLKLHDMEVIRFWNNEVMQNMEGVLVRIAEKVTPPDLLLA
ncbi:MAG: DNA-cytosine methyltransferase [Nitrospirae bacterium CG_4_10_14_0_8_um_filter_41_23]|nr:MAG: DNA-cytosine methyltransferase [Nitrospirae bacterium CG11_big_fil_rev_8_21_14_0_20_41_14]PIW88056.1 MAG: DNA-cytosine methyltransferase [Nitrospirae bacterium CG_4_8_14_3_um_filter_41_47]PIY87559.1 MAG: DNA-cytosine methyltransferase [Nitrospirae bacterium CG_4_10_14_0_8_um_filter_41_23]